MTLAESASVQQACKMIGERRAGSVLVTDENGRLGGIFTGRDAVCRVLAMGKDAARTKLVEVMTATLVTMPPDKTAIELLRMMRDGGFRPLPVVDSGKLIGPWSPVVTFVGTSRIA